MIETYVPNAVPATSKKGFIFDKESCKHLYVLLAGQKSGEFGSANNDFAVPIITAIIFDRSRHNYGGSETNL